jgi:hypothetical protein
MRRPIPGALLAVVAEVSSNCETHASLDSLFTYAGAPGDPPDGSKHAKALAWLRLANKDDTVNPLEVVGRIIETYMEQELDPNDTWDQQRLEVVSERRRGSGSEEDSERPDLSRRRCWFASNARQLGARRWKDSLQA